MLNPTILTFFDHTTKIFNTIRNWNIVYWNFLPARSQFRWRLRQKVSWLVDPVSRIWAIPSTNIRKTNRQEPRPTCAADPTFQSSGWDNSGKGFWVVESWRWLRGFFPPSRRTWSCRWSRSGRRTPYEGFRIRTKCSNRRWPNRNFWRTKKKSEIKLVVIVRLFFTSN